MIGAIIGTLFKNMNTQYGAMFCNETKLIGTLKLKMHSVKLKFNNFVANF